MTREEAQEQLDNCCGPYPRPPLKRRPLGGIEREQRRQRVEIEEARRMYEELGRPNRQRG